MSMCEGSGSRPGVQWVCRALNRGRGWRRSTFAWYAMCLGLTALLATGYARANQYWIDWEGEDWPENQGWTRVWGNRDGLFQGTGAVRSLHQGVMTSDSLYDPWVFDFSEISRPGSVDPGPGEFFVAQWRLRVDENHPDGAGDQGVSICSDEAWALGYEFTIDHIRSAFEGYLDIPFQPLLWHDYEITSPNMRTYDLFIDGALRHQGTFQHLISKSYVAWGDGGQPISSLADWDYFRFGVVPEPSGLALLLCLAVWYGARR
jgi:hypothetical protein